MPDIHCHFNLFLSVLCEELCVLCGYPLPVVASGDINWTTF